MASSSDPVVARGLAGVIAAETRLSHVDGVAGRLVIAGYDLEELAGRVDYESAAHLLWRGTLPGETERVVLEREMATLRRLPPLTRSVLRATAGVAPIDALRMAAATLTLDLPDPDGVTPAADLARAQMLAARLPVMVATHLRLARGEEPLAPRPELSRAADFLHMALGREPDAAAAGALDTYWVTVMEHGFNASTFAARVIASTRADMVSAVTGAIGALKGPLHGGALAPVLGMLLAIGEPANAEPWLRDELAAGRRIMGFGDRVYRVRDPRAEVLAQDAATLAATPADRALLDLARHVEAVAGRLLAERHPGRALAANLDFASAPLLHLLGLPPEAFVAVFACGRVAGWSAHVIEQRAEDRLIRPGARYVGPRGLRVPR